MRTPQQRVLLGSAGLGSAPCRASKPVAWWPGTCLLHDNCCHLLLHIAADKPDAETCPYYIKRRAKSALRIWSDAMLQDGIGRLGFAFYDPEDSTYFFSSCIVPTWMFAMFKFPTHCIGQLEIMAALFVYLTIEKFDVSRLKDRGVLHWVDNTSAIFGLYKGYSASEDSSRLIQFFHLLMAKLNFRTRWEYVASKANVADLLWAIG